MKGKAMSKIKRYTAEQVLFALISGGLIFGLVVQIFFRIISLQG